MTERAIPPTHVVPAGGIQAWTQPDASLSAPQDVAAGVPLVIIETRGGWSHVEATNGWAGWVGTDRLQLLPPPTSPTPPPPPQSPMPPPTRPEPVGLATAVTSFGSTATRGAGRSSSMVGGAGWQVVVGPTLPSFPALGGAVAGRGAGRLLQNPAVLLAVTTVVAVGPALVTGTAGAGTLGVPRLLLGLASAVGVALAPRLGGRAQRVAILLPLAFVAVQVVALVTTVSALTGGESGIAAAGPHVLAAGVTVVTALRTVWSLHEAHRPAAQ